MNEEQDALMNRAASLTREGRLVEATRVIQDGLGMLGRNPAPAPSPSPSRPAAPSRPPKFRWLTGIGSLVRSRVAPAGDAVSIHGERTQATEHRSTFETASHAHGGLTRRYKLFVPANVARSPALVVMLHGCTQDPDDFAAGTRMNERAESDGFVVLYPQQSRSDNPSACWNWFNRKDQRRDSGEAGFLADLVRTVVARHGVDEGRVFVAGLSAGGAMAAILASEYPDLFAAAGVHSGLPAGAAGNVPDALNAMRGGRSRPRPADADAGVHAIVPGAKAVPTIVFHGDADATVHPSNGDAVVQSVLGRSTQATVAASDAVPGTRRITRTRHLLDDGSTLVEQWALHGAGHAWAGGSPTGSYTDPQGFDATDRLLGFFDEHGR